MPAMQEIVTVLDDGTEVVTTAPEKYTPGVFSRALFLSGASAELIAKSNDVTSRPIYCSQCGSLHAVANKTGILPIGAEKVLRKSTSIGCDCDRPDPLRWHPQK
jgi:hypothetical protein